MIFIEFSFNFENTDPDWWNKAENNKTEISKFAEVIQNFLFTHVWN
jgi:hypothetical protein